MNTIIDKKMTTDTMRTCARCSYIMFDDEELCESCKHIPASSNLMLW